MWLFAFQQVSAGPDLSDQSPDSGISVHLAGQYHTDVMIRKLHLQLLQANQEKERERQEKKEIEKEPGNSCRNMKKFKEN